MTQKIVALDYDGTTSLDIDTFIEVSDILLKAGFIVYVVTMRFTNEPVPTMLSERLPVIYTGRKGKDLFMKNLGLPVSIWIDDNPYFVLMDAYEEQSDDPHHAINKFSNPQFETLRTTKEDLISVIA